MPCVCAPTALSTDNGMDDGGSSGRTLTIAAQLRTEWNEVVGARHAVPSLPSTRARHGAPCLARQAAIIQTPRAEWELAAVNVSRQPRGGYDPGAATRERPAGRGRRRR